MSHADVVKAIEATGGELVASFVLDARGQTIGARHERKVHCCSGCGEPGHTIARCRGKGEPPKLSHAERRHMGQNWLTEAAKAAGDPLVETKAILAARAEQRRAARRRRSCPHSLRSQPATCSLCVGAKPRVVTHDGAELLIDGEPAGRGLDRLTPMETHAYARRGGLAKARRTRP